MRFAIITDLHYSDNITPGGATSMDLPFKRVLSSASVRVREFLRVTKRYNPDKYLFLGDLIDMGSGNVEATMAIHEADVVASGVNYGDGGKVLYIPGNHDLTAFGSPTNFYTNPSILTLHPWDDITDANGWWWSNSPLDRAAWFLDVEDFRIIGLAFASETSFDDGEWGSAVDDNQLDWLAEGGGPLDTARPIIVLSHGYLPKTEYPGWTMPMIVTGTLTPDVTGTYFRVGTCNDKPCYGRQDEQWFIWWHPIGFWLINDDLGNITSFKWEGEAFRYDVEGDYLPIGGALGTATVVAAVRGLLEAQGNVKAVLTGHWHKGTEDITGSMVDIVNGVPYYGLRGSVIGRHTEDYTSNSFYLFDIDATAGVQRITQFKRDQFGRSRTNVGVFPNDKQFGRDRYSF